MTGHQTARQAGLIACHACALLLHWHEDGTQPVTCPRCGSAIHQRKPASLARTGALLLTAAICYIPANLLPIMTVIRFGQGEPDTILSGIRHLLESGLWPLAMLIFFASIVVPMVKLGMLSYLLLSIHRRSHWRLMDRTVLYRLMESFGHWSMVDIFLISILTALVQLDALTTIEPGDGATYFAAVVVLTMLAVKSFDPRLMWDTVDAPPTNLHTTTTMPVWLGHQNGGNDDPN